MNLIEEAKNKNPIAFDELMQTQLKKLYRIAMTMLQNEDDAADAIQEATLKCWQRISQVRENDYFETWLTRILINQCNDILRNRKKFVYVEEIPENINDTTLYEDNYSTVEWKDIISKLGEKYRLVMELYYVDGLGTKEISKMLHITETGVRTRLVRGRKQLAQMMNDNPKK